MIDEEDTVAAYSAAAVPELDMTGDVENGLGAEERGVL